MSQASERGATNCCTALLPNVFIEAHLSLKPAGHILVIVDYYLLAVSPLPGPGRRIGQHLTAARFADMAAAADAVSSLPPRGATGGHLAAVMPDRTAVTGRCDNADRRLERYAAVVGELT